MNPYRVTFYCPDRHILYDGSTPDRKGVGGGVTSRVRMARALARAGQQVEMVVNCPRRRRIDGVLYRPLDEVRRIDADVLLMNTSGGDLDLSPILNLEVEARFRFIWTSGNAPPGGLARVPYDYLYAKSNFLCRLAREQWDVPSERIFVAHNGIEAAHYARFLRRPPQRDPFRLVYFSHPSKGLATSLAVLRNLRVKDPRFTLSVYGGDALWGQQQGAPPDDPGASFHGLIGQKALARELFGCGFSLSLQARLEPFGMVITEAMRAGCIVLASPVGAYPELIRDGEDGYLLPGDHESEDVQARAAELILKLAQNPQASAYVRRNAQTMMWDTDTMVRVWLRHWDWWFEGKPLAAPAGGECPQCGGVSLWLADGYHCTVCGIYRRGRTKIETPVDVRE